MSAGTAMLALEQTPPLAVPARFFVTAPLFAFAAVVVAAYAGPDLLVSRWQPQLLAATHLLTLGCIAMVMCGAMFQLLPVLAGVQMVRGVTTSTLVHLLLSSGTLALAIGFAGSYPGAFVAAFVLLAAALLLFISIIMVALARAKSLHDTVWAMRVALAALLITLLFGLWLTAGHAGWLPLPRQLTDLHLAWGLLGWVGVLLAGVAYQVVPMFQITAEYPRRLRRILAWGVALLLGLWSGLHEAGAPARVAGSGLAILFVAFAAVTLHLQRRRLRRLPDVTVSFWHIGMVAILLAALLWLATPWLPLRFQPAAAVVWGELVIVGAGVSVISGMLYKIVPFLVWLHLNNRLQASGQWQGRIPNMRQVIAERHARWHLYLHLAGFALLIGASVVSPLLYYPALLLLGGAFLLQFANLLSALQLFRRVALEQEG